MGVELCLHFPSILDFSTARATYPQIIASYPQIPGLESDDGGFTYPLHVGGIWSE
jgi:hypothetical protein